MGKWEMVRLGDVCRVQGGYAFKSERFTYNEIPILRIGDIQNGTVTIDYSVCSSPEFWDNNEQFRVSFGDILIAMSGATVGKIGVYNLRDKALLNQRVGKISINKEYANDKYILEILKSETIRLQILQLAAGCAQPNISGKQLESMIIPLPPLSIQQKIADILDRANALIEKRKAQIEKLDLLVKSQFIEIFGDPVTNPMGWEVRKLDGIAAIVSGVTKGRKINGTPVQEIPYMRVANVKDGHIDLSEIKTIIATIDEIQKYSLMPGDVLLTEGGDPDKLGRGAIWRGQIVKCIHQNHIFRVRVDATLINPVYFATFLLSNHAKLYFLKAAKQTTGIASINMTQLKALPVHLPPLDLQNKFEFFVERVETLKSLLQQSLEKLELNYKSLMQKCFQ